MFPYQQQMGRVFSFVIFLPSNIKIWFTIVLNLTFKDNNISKQVKSKITVLGNIFKLMNNCE